MNANIAMLQESFATFWAGRNTRERTILAWAAVLIAGVLVYAIFLGPALTGRVQLAKALPPLKQQAAQMHALAQQATGLLANAAAPAEPISKESVDAALVRKGLKAQNVSVSGDLVRLQLTAVSFAATLDWLDEMQKTARLSVMETNIVAQPAVDMVNVTLTLRQQRNEQ